MSIDRHVWPGVAYVHPCDGAPEPLLSVWHPAALRMLKEAADKAQKVGPCSSFKKAWRMIGDEALLPGPGLCTPTKAEWLFDADIPQEWRTLRKLLLYRSAGRDVGMHGMAKGAWAIREGEEKQASDKPRITSLESAYEIVQNGARCKRRGKRCGIQSDAILHTRYIAR